jgi:hypothetical protein
VGGDVGHIEPGERFHRCAGIVVGRATDQRKAGGVDDGVHRHHPIAAEIALHRGARIQPAEKAGITRSPAASIAAIKPS